MKPEILFVDDDPIIIESIQALFDMEPYSVTYASSGKEALELCKSKNYTLVITDLNMPEMSGAELILHLNQFENVPLIFVQSVESDLNPIIDLMKKGAYDYIIKPYEKRKFIHRIQKALEVAELRTLKRNLEKEREIRLADMVNWNIWKETIIKKDQEKNDNTLIESIRTAFSQGVGFGSLISVVNRIAKKAKPDEGFYRVPNPLMEMLFENASAAGRIIDFFEELEGLNSSDNFENMKIAKFHSIMDQYILEDLLDFEKIKKHHIVLNENVFHHYNLALKIEKDVLLKAIKELFLNAFKFSKPESKIFLTMQVIGSNFYITILNSPLEDQKGNLGVPEEYANLIFEPFFRMSKFVHESYPTMDFGLGLSFVHRVVQKHQARIHVTNLKSHIPDTEGMMTAFEIELPLYPFNPA